MSAHPFQTGTRVHHRGGIYSRTFFLNGPDDLEGHANGGPYWGTVLAYKPSGDGYEYLVQQDEGWTNDDPTWWASYHIDRHFKPNA